MLSESLRFSFLIIFLNYFGWKSLSQPACARPSSISVTRSPYCAKCVGCMQSILPSLADKSSAPYTWQAAFILEQLKKKKAATENLGFMRWVQSAGRDVCVSNSHKIPQRCLWPFIAAFISNNVRSKFFLATFLFPFILNNNKKLCKNTYT